MKKFLAVVKHEYKKIVLKWTFLIATLLFPLIAVGFAVIPALIFSSQGDVMRMVVVDHDDFYPRTPARGQARTIPDTPGAGIAMTARSTCSGTDAMSGNVFTLRISP